MAHGPYQTAAAAAARLIDAVFPDPAAVDARTRFATWLGVTSGVDRPGELQAVKLYANLDAPGAAAAGGEVGLAERWPAWAQADFDRAGGRSWRSHGSRRCGSTGTGASPLSGCT